MSDNQRLEDLRRRVQQDPSSIAFAQLAEEYRRAGQAQDAVDASRAGLAIHPTYLSARVTLGRALLELNQLDDARQEFELVRKSAPDNLAAIRGLAEIYHRSGSLVDALAQYRAALALARNDPDLEQTVKELESQVEPQQPEHAAGLTFEQATPFVHTPSAPLEHVEHVEHVKHVATVEKIEAAEPVKGLTTETRAMRMIAALEQWLHAIAVSNVTRAERHA